MAAVPTRFFHRNRTGDGFGWWHKCRCPEFLIGRSARIYSLADARQHQRASWWYEESPYAQAGARSEWLRTHRDESVHCKDFQLASFGSNNHLTMLVGHVDIDEIAQEMQVVIWKQQPVPGSPEQRLGRLEWTVRGIDWPHACMCGQCKVDELHIGALCPLLVNFEDSTPRPQGPEDSTPVVDPSVPLLSVSQQGKTSLVAGDTEEPGDKERKKTPAGQPDWERILSEVQGTGPSGFRGGCPLPQVPNGVLREPVQLFPLAKRTNMGRAHNPIYSGRRGDPSSKRLLYHAEPSGQCLAWEFFRVGEFITARVTYESQDGNQSYAGYMNIWCENRGKGKGKGRGVLYIWPHGLQWK